jgi:hypothetical protein
MKKKEKKFPDGTHQSILDSLTVKKFQEQTKIAKLPLMGV